jgi:HKD family nuclease
VIRCAWVGIRCSTGRPMDLRFIAQPKAAFRIGDFLTTSLSDPKWTEFRAAVAFVKRSGTKHVRQQLADFCARGGTAVISAGVDSGGTSAEGLSDLMNAVNGHGNVFVFNNANNSTFHPKVYFFQNDREADVVVGSGNLTEGGLFTNYEASFRVRLLREDPGHEAIRVSLLEALNTWSTPAEGLCYALDPALLARLQEQGLVPVEASAWGDEKATRADRDEGEPSIFSRHAVPAAPKPPKVIEESTVSETEPEDHEETEEEEGLEVPTPVPAPAQQGHYQAFVMTLQKTDVGVGQITAGTSRRSPEIFIPLVARDFDPEFWGWPDLFVSDPHWSGVLDRDGRGKMDRAGVMVRLGGAIFPVHMWYNPDKKDLRIRSEHMRSAGAIGDILYVERSDGAAGFSYYVDVVPQGSPRHAQLLSLCVNKVRNSKKEYGYV